jgi:hypothetical protein
MTSADDDVISHDRLADELKVLRKGRALGAPDLDGKVGPALRALIQSAGYSTELLRVGLTEVLRSLIRQLPRDLAVAATAALALEPEVSLPFYQDRIRWAAQQLYRDDRTVRRRVDYALASMTEMAYQQYLSGEDASSIPERSWYTENLRLVFMLDRPTPELFEEREIRSTGDYVAEVDLDLRVPDAPVDVVYGARLVASPTEGKHVGEELTKVKLALPHALTRGESHRLALWFRSSELASSLRPHYLCTPFHTMKKFDLCVRFNLGDLPSRIWLIDGIKGERLHNDLEPELSGKILLPDPVGEVHVEFHQMSPNHSYGIAWTPAVRVNSH